MQTVVKLLFVFFISSMPMCALTKEYVEISCFPLSSGSGYLQKGDFAIALPGDYKERHVESPDSNVWFFYGDFGEISIDVGFKPIRTNNLDSSSPCGSNGVEKIKIFSKGGGRYVVTFVPQYNMALSVEFHIKSESAGLNSVIAGIISSFRWVGNPSEIQVLETEPQDGSAVVVNEIGVPFEVVIDDFVARNFGVLKEVGSDFVVVEQYIYNNYTGEFHKEIKTIKKK